MAKQPVTNWLCKNCNRFQFSRVPKDWICKKCRKAAKQAQNSVGY